MQRQEMTETEALRLVKRVSFAIVCTLFMLEINTEIFHLNEYIMGLFGFFISYRLSR